MPHYVIVRMPEPDSRYAVAAHDDPVVPVMRRVLSAGAAGQRPQEADLAAIREWLDSQPPEARREILSMVRLPERADLTSLQAHGIFDSKEQGGIDEAC